MSDHCHNNGSSLEEPQNGSHHLALVPDSPCLQPLTYPGDSLAHHSSPQGTPVCKAYPSPVAKHEEVVAKGSLFLQTLGKFHATVGTKFMVPVIGGKELDLHLLYVEVTSRGGLQQVIKDRKWKDITAIFNFPPTATNASFVLRKYYISLLYHYEQVYFFGAQGQPIPPPAALPAPSPVSHSKNINELANPPSVEAKSLLKKRKRVDPMSSMGHPVTGVIDGKFENAYLITVMVGSEKLRGVLYEMPAGVSGEQFLQAPSCTNNSNNGDTASGVRPRRRRRRKDEMKKRDPDHPKPNRSGYNFFFAEQHTKLKALHPGKDREISKMIGDSWNKLTEEAKAVYQELGLKDKERYKSEMEEYRERQKAHSQDKGILVSRNEGSNQGLENHIKIQFQDQGVPLTRNEDSNQALDNNSDLLKHQPDQSLSLQLGIQGNGFKVAQLSDKAGMVGADMSIKQESLAGTKMSTEQENSQGSDCKNMVLG
uniref:HMG box domain-containing protein n=1 Tax=Picea sitchensis TaxID=3332 RepID=A9NW05_PICSI|nr:unknown [Picea sitchensis]